MGMDRNTLIGFLLIGALLIGMFMLNSKSRLAFEAEQQRIADSIKKSKPVVDTTEKTATVPSANPANIPMSSPTQVSNIPVISVLENDVLKISFSNKGAQPVKVEMKKFDRFNGQKVVIQEGDFNKFSYAINAADNRTAETSQLFFQSFPVEKIAGDASQLRFETADSTGRKITHLYSLKPGQYMLDFSILLEGSDRLFSRNNISFLWQTEAPLVEKDYKYELTQSHICFVENSGFDFEYIGSGDNKTFSKPVDWITLKQQFFAKTLSAKNKFSSATVSWAIPKDSTEQFLARTTTVAQYSLPGGSQANIPLQYYFGPSDYNVLKQYHNQLENIVPYGNGIFAFVKYINRHFLLPVFDFLQKHVASMGMVILLLTLLIRLITSPILYKSYLSGAKMKVLKPEVDALKAKFTDPKTNQLDQQAFGMEQMKLWKSAGVSPLGGCLPALLQIPIFMSLYYFFQSNIDLRGKNFLWAKDLAQYDSIYQLPFHIPFYGDHVSLFTLTAVLTSLLISIYSMANMQDNSNPLMKYMPYIFPFILLGVFNNLPAALTWYYTISNTITLILQVIIQKYIINHDKIMDRINENRKKPVKKSKMAERIEAMQESQRKIKELKAKNGKS
jgi:YidC/Oxa1 family membrane protein insertase